MGAYDRQGIEPHCRTGQHEPRLPLHPLLVPEEGSEHLDVAAHEGQSHPWRVDRHAEPFRIELGRKAFELTATFGAARDLLGDGADEQRPWVADARRGAVLVHRLHELAFEGEDRVPAAGELFDLQLDRGSVQTVMGGETADDVAQFSGEATCLLEAPDGRVSRFPRSLCRFEAADGRSGFGWTETVAVKLNSSSSESGRS